MVKKSLFARIFHRGDDDRGAASRERPARAASAAPRSAPAARREPELINERAVREREARRAQQQPRAAAATATASPPKAAAPPSSSPRNGTNGANGAHGAPPHRTSAPPREESRPARIDASRMSEDDELEVKVKQGFQGLSNVLNGIEGKIDRQHRVSEDLMVSVRQIPEMMKDVPDASKAGLELLASISRILSEQGRATTALLNKIDELPTAIDAMESRFHDAVAEVSRKSGDADRTAKETQRQLSNAFGDVRKTVESVSQEHSQRQEELIRRLQSHQEQQDQRVEQLLKRSGTSMKLVIFLLVVVVGALLLVVQAIANG